MYDETALSMAPEPVQRLLWGVVGRTAGLFGMTGIDDAYLDPSFWERHVEQPGWETCGWG